MLSDNNKQQLDKLEKLQQGKKATQKKKLKSCENCMEHTKTKLPKTKENRGLAEGSSMNKEATTIYLLSKIHRS